MRIRVQNKNKCNSELISELTEKSTLIKRTGIRPEKNGEMTGHLGCEQAYNSNQGLATFNIDDDLLHLVPNDCHILVGGQRISAKIFKNNFAK